MKSSNVLNCEIPDYHLFPLRPPQKKKKIQDLFGRAAGLNLFNLNLLHTVKIRHGQIGTKFLGPDSQVLLHNSIKQEKICAKNCRNVAKPVLKM